MSRWAVGDVRWVLLIGLAVGCAPVGYIGDDVSGGDDGADSAPGGDGGGEGDVAGGDLGSATLLSCDLAPGGCDEVFVGTGGYIEITHRDEPGKTFCIPAGDYRGIYLNDVKGGDGAPLRLINCGGKVVLDSTGYSNGITGTRVQHVRITGTGDPAERYGIEQKNANANGVDFDIGITDLEIDHLEVHHNGYMGIGVRSYPRCDGVYHRGNFTQRNTLIHDNYVHHASTGEGLYVGTSHYHATVPRAYIEAGCPSSGYLEPPLVGVRVYDNLLEDIGRDAIQVGAAIDGMQIYDNVVRRYALEQAYGHVGGIQINPGSVGEVYGNWVEAFVGDAAGTAIQYAGGGDAPIDIHDNVLVGSPTALLTLGHLLTPNHATVFRNNTVVNDGGQAMYLFCNGSLSVSDPHPITMTDNIFVGYERVGAYIFTDGSGDWFKIFDSNANRCPINGTVYGSAHEADLLVPGNFYSADVAAAQFVDAAAGDYRVLVGSPAYGMGANGL